MRDGVRLYTAVYTPKNKKATHPILLNRTPYGCRPYGKKNSSFWQDSIFHNYLQAEYIFVFQDVRGRGMSTGEITNVRPFIENKQGNDTDEASDAYDTIEWLLRKIRRHNNRIGIYGASYDGFYTLMAAASGHPAIKAISPQAPVCDWWMGDDFHRNGAFALFDAVSFLPNFGFKERSKSPEPPAFKSPIENNAWNYFSANRLSDITSSLTGRVPFWDEMMQHPDYDDFWQSRNALRAAKWIKVPTLIVGGAFDAEDNYGTWALYYALRENGSVEDCRLIIGP
jgi:putative CocE/NonD family hydrolase